MVKDVVLASREVAKDNVLSSDVKLVIVRGSLETENLVAFEEEAVVVHTHSEKIA
jgi:hypothetical protein